MLKSGLAETASYLRDATIAGPFTGTGGAVTGIRVSGPLAVTLLQGLTHQSDWQQQPRKMRLCSLVTIEGRTLDEALAVYFEEGASFTGEPTAELFLHGGALVRSEVLEELFLRGCKPALPGEFSFRAVRNGRLTLDQAEAIRDLIGAPSRVAHGLALERLGGSSARTFGAQAEHLRSVLSLAEAGIDFSDQDLAETGLQKLQGALAQGIQFLRATEATLERGRRIQEGLSVVLAGLPNAGKSSLFNELLGADRSLISEEAGTTRDILREHVRLRGGSGEDLSFWIHDTAGLRDAPGRVEKMGIERALETAQQADLVVFLVDPEQEPSAVLMEWDRLGRPTEKTILVLHKADLCPDTSARERQLRAWSKLLGESPGIWVSANTGEGVDTLVHRLVQRGQALTQTGHGEMILTRVEQQDAVRQAREDLERAREALSHDLFAADLRSALEHLSFFIGKTGSEEILSRIFSQFCIGK